MWTKKNSTNYQAYADIYDELKGDRSPTIDLVMGLIRKRRPDAHSILDLACGTGSITQGFADHFSDVVGLDSSRQMLQFAKRKVPAAHFIQGNMANFQLDKHFDVITCLHNSVNHLVTFQEWEALLHNAANHLNEGGVFIFDVNPIDKMDDMAARSPTVRQTGNDYVIIQIFKDENRTGSYVWDVKILKKKKNGYVVKHEPIEVSSYPNDKILAALHRDFEVVDSFVPVAPTIYDDVGRMYYVCIKK